MKIWISLCIFLIIPRAFSQSICAPLLEYCSYYTCISNELGCGPQDYFNSFGKKYCSQFERNENHFSPHGQVFLKEVANCLREEIENNLSTITCSTAKPKAASHHVRCYIEAGFCGLSFMDRYRIFQTIYKPVLFDKIFRNVASEIYEACRR